VNQLTQVMEYVRAHPTYGLGIAVAAGVIYFLLNRKSRLVREADRRIEELQHERSDHYRKLRPPH
jgi:hypothetical protein